jgi:hypothetical protein
MMVAAALLTGCAPPPPPASQAPQKKIDPTAEPAYAQGVAELAGMARDAARLYREGKREAAGDIVTRGEAIANRLLAAPNPTVEAMEAASDLDDLYGRMLLGNGNVGWARLQFQKNIVRWKSWKPQTEETAKRYKAARDAIAECDRRLAQ